MTNLCWEPPEFPPEFEEARKTAERLWGDREEEEEGEDEKGREDEEA